MSLSQKEIQDIAGSVAIIVSKIVQEKEPSGGLACSSTHTDIVMKHTDTLARLESVQLSQGASLNRIEQKLEILFEKHDKQDNKTSKLGIDITKLQTEKETVKSSAALVISILTMVAGFAAWMFEKVFNK